LAARRLVACATTGRPAARASAAAARKRARSAARSSGADGISSPHSFTASLFRAASIRTPARTDASSAMNTLSARAAVSSDRRGIVVSIGPAAATCGAAGERSAAARRSSVHGGPPGSNTAVVPAHR
jgi:hypothetical protein